MGVAKVRRLWVGLLLAALSLAARAQPTPGRLDSVEWLVEDSDLVVVGKIVSSTPIGPSQWQQIQLAKVQVSETLKGPKQLDLRFVMLADSRDPRIMQVMRDGKDALMFLRKSSRAVSAGGLADHLERYFAREAFAPRSYMERGWILELDPNAKIQAFTMDLQPLKGPETLLAQARRAVREEPKSVVTRSHDFAFNTNNASEFPIGTFAGMGLAVAVPIDSRLELLAQRWALSSDPHARQSAIEALVYFKSDKNERILHHLLSDPFESMENTSGGDLTPAKFEKHYPIREAAQWLLDAWGEKRA